jgi:hypothetical protein
MQERTQEGLERILGSTGSLTIDKLIMQNSELIKKCDTLNDKIDNLEKIIVNFIENKKEEISEVFITVILIIKPFVYYETFRLITNYKRLFIICFIIRN